MAARIPFKNCLIQHYINYFELQKNAADYQLGLARLFAADRAPLHQITSTKGQIGELDRLDQVKVTFNFMTRFLL